MLRAAIKIADQNGIESLTMRRVADELGAEAMSLYYHVASKEDLLDGIADAIVTEINDVVGTIDAPSSGASWKTAVRQRILSAREVLLRHRWVPRVLETRTSTSPAVLLYYDGLLRLMRDGGFSYDRIHHALHALGSRALGFSQELFDPSGGTGDDEAAAVLQAMTDQIPHLVAMFMEVAHDDPDSTLGWCDDQTEFEFGLDLILDGLDTMRTTADRGPNPPLLREREVEPASWPGSRRRAVAVFQAGESHISVAVDQAGKQRQTGTVDALIAIKTCPDLCNAPVLDYDVRRADRATSCIEQGPAVRQRSHAGSIPAVPTGFQL